MNMNSFPSAEESFFLRSRMVERPPDNVEIGRIWVVGERAGLVDQGKIEASIKDEISKAGLKLAVAATESKTILNCRVIVSPSPKIAPESCAVVVDMQLGQLGRGTTGIHIIKRTQDVMAHIEECVKHLVHELTKKKQAPQI